MPARSQTSGPNADHDEPIEAWRTRMQTAEAKLTYRAEVFVEGEWHAAIGLGQLTGTLVYLWYSVRVFARVAEQAAEAQAEADADAEREARDASAAG